MVELLFCVREKRRIAGNMVSLGVLGNLLGLERGGGR